MPKTLKTLGGYGEQAWMFRLRLDTPNSTQSASDFPWRHLEVRAKFDGPRKVQVQEATQNLLVERPIWLPEIIVRWKAIEPHFRRFLRTRSKVIPAKHRKCRDEKDGILLTRLEGKNLIRVTNFDKIGPEDERTEAAIGAWLDGTMQADFDDEWQGTDVRVNIGQAVDRTIVAGEPFRDVSFESGIFNGSLFVHLASEKMAILNKAFREAKPPRQTTTETDAGTFKGVWGQGFTSRGQSLAFMFQDHPLEKRPEEYWKQWGFGPVITDVPFSTSFACRLDIEGQVAVLADSIPHWRAAASKAFTGHQAMEFMEVIDEVATVVKDVTGVAIDL